MKLPPIAEKFVTHFGEMGGRWGINRTSSRVFALLYISDRPLHAGEIVDALGFSRSHLSTAIKELVGWRLVQLRHVPGDRRDHFAASDNVWEIARVLVEERKRREFEPTLGLLEDIRTMKPASSEEGRMQERIDRMRDLMELFDDWYSDVQRLETEKLVRLLKVGSKVYSMYAKVGGRAPAPAPAKKRASG